MSVIVDDLLQYIYFKVLSGCLLPFPNQIVFLVVYICLCFFYGIATSSVTVRRIPLTPSSSNKFIIRAVVGDVVSEASDIITVITGMGLILFKWSMCTVLCAMYVYVSNMTTIGICL